MKKLLFIIGFLGCLFIASAQEQVITPGMTGAQLRTAVNDKFARHTDSLDLLDDYQIQLYGFISDHADSLALHLGRYFNHADTLALFLQRYFAQNDSISVLRAFTLDTLDNSLYYDYLHDKKQFVNLGDVIDAYLTDYVKTADIPAYGDATQVWQFEVGEAGSPIANGDSIIWHSDFAGKYIKVYRDGLRLFSNIPAYKAKSFHHGGDSIVIYDPVSDGEMFVIELTSANALEDYFFVHALSFPIEGQGVDTATMVFSATDSVEVRATGNVNFAVTRADEDFGDMIQHTVLISCAAGNYGTVYVGEKDKIVSYGNHRDPWSPDTQFYTGDNATAPILSWNLNAIPNQVEKIRQVTAYSNILDAYGNQAYPDSLRYIWVVGANLERDYVDTSLPDNLYYYRISSSNWSSGHTGAMPSGLTTFFTDTGVPFYWSDANPLPVGLTTLSLRSTNTNWTGTVLGNSAVPITMTTLGLRVYRDEDMNAATLISLLESIHTGTNNLPATVRVWQYAAGVGDNPSIADIQAAEGAIDGTTAQQIKYWINLILGHGGITTFELNSGNNFTLPE